MLGMLFEDEGHRTTTVASAQDALELAARAVFLPDVIIADYNLPGEMTGAQVIARLREKLRRDIPAIILTGDISSDTLSKIAAAGCVHMSKPAEPEILTQEIEGFLAEAAQRMPTTSVADFRSPAADAPITVFVVDDDPNSRDDMQELLREHGYTAETYDSGEAFLSADQPDRSGCLVVDAMMPGMGGIALLESLAASGRGLPAIVITGYGDVAMAVQAMKVGAADFLEKPIRADELVASIARALELGRDSEKRSTWRKTAAQRIAGLTPREREVMDLVVQGRPNKIIADALGISQRTVENHRAAVMKRTGASTLPDLIRLTMAAGDGQLTDV
jgi:two-component system CheB/CheR fusion protein